MNKKIVAISILLLMMCAMAVAVFAQDNKQYEYAVTMTLRSTSRNETKQVTEYVWASSHSEAMDLAKTTCEWKYSGWEVTSCGYPKATGKSR